MKDEADAFYCYPVYEEIEGRMREHSQEHKHVAVIEQLEGDHYILLFYHPLDKGGALMHIGSFQFTVRATPKARELGVCWFKKTGVLANKEMFPRTYTYRKCTVSAKAAYAFVRAAGKGFAHLERCIRIAKDAEEFAMLAELPSVQN